VRGLDDDVGPHLARAIRPRAPACLRSGETSALPRWNRPIWAWMGRHSSWQRRSDTHPGFVS
jgi:hypothetical protein